MSKSFQQLPWTFKWKSLKSKFRYTRGFSAYPQQKFVGLETIYGNVQTGCWFRSGRKSCPSTVKRASSLEMWDFTCAASYRWCTQAKNRVMLKKPRQCEDVLSEFRTRQNSWTLHLSLWILVWKRSPLLCVTFPLVQTLYTWQRS